MRTRSPVRPQGPFAGGSSSARIETSSLSLKAILSSHIFLFTSEAHKCLNSGGTSETSQPLVGVCSVLCGNSSSGTDAAKEENNGDENEDDNDELAGSRATSAVIGPSTLCGAHVLLDLVSSKLVVDKAAERNAVSEELKGRNGVAEDHHGCDDEENILEYTAESHDKAGGSADLL